MAPSAWKKLMYTSVLGAFFCSSALIQRYSMGIIKETYSPFTAVLLAEILKVFISATVVVAHGHELQPIVRTSSTMALPAASYFIQNSIGYYIFQTGIGAKEVDALMQAKVLMTALMSMIVLRRNYSALRWRALANLVLGGCIIVRSIDRSSETSGSGMRASMGGKFAGVVGTLLSCLTGATSGVVLELQFK